MRFAIVLALIAGAPSAALAQRPRWGTRPSETIAYSLNPPEVFPQGTGPARDAPFVLDGPGFEAALVNGIAAFVVDRAQREATLALLLRVQGEVCTETSTALPATCGMIQRQEGRFVSSVVPVLPELVRNDLESLAERALGPVAGQSELARLALVLIDLAQRVRTGEHPAPALVASIDARVTWDETRDCRGTPIDYGLHALRSALVVMQSPTGPLIGPGTLRPPSTLRGPLLERLREELSLGCRPAETALQDLARLEPSVLALLERGGELQSRLAALSTAAHAGQPTLIPGLRVASSAFGLVRAGAAVARVSTGDDAATAKLERAAARGEALTEAFAQRAYARAIVELVAWFDELDVSHILPDSFRRFIPLAAGLASAQSPEEVQAALESAAAPIGSYREKRGKDASMHLCINAYLGVSAGVERLAAAGNLSRALTKQTPTLGVFAPIGLELSTGIPTPVVSSFGVFLSVLDVGALTQLRLESAEVGELRVQENAALGFAQVVSPGLFLTLGLSEVLPLTLGAGAQLTPELRRVERVPAGGAQGEEGQLVTELPALRAQVFLGIDLVLFNL